MRNTCKSGTKENAVAAGANQFVLNKLQEGYIKLEISRLRVRRFISRVVRVSWIPRGSDEIVKRSCRFSLVRLAGPE